MMSSKTWVGCVSVCSLMTGSGVSVSRRELGDTTSRDKVRVRVETLSGGPGSASVVAAWVLAQRRAFVCGYSCHQAQTTAQDFCSNE